MLRNLFCLGNLAGLVLFSVDLCGQSFSSGSTGADGALNYPSAGTYTFDPKSFNPPLNPAGDNVFNFTTINIAAGVTLKLTSKVLTGPVYWLAQGAVTISGIVDLNGEDGAAASFNSIFRIPAAGGAGGYSGGVGGALVAGNPNLPPPQPGSGPGGGTASTATCSASGGNASFTGSQYLIPLIGGSGGGGGCHGFADGSFAFGGSGGGGAILIASSVSITYGGIIRANGGSAGNNNSADNGGRGSGGAIRLIAPTISDGTPNGCGPNAGRLQALGGNSVGNNGIIRLETLNLTIFGGGCVQPSPLISTPFNVTLPATPPGLLRVTSINGIQINANPFSFPDAVINSTAPVTVNVQAQFIPVGTVPKIIVMSETGPDQTVSCSTPLTGTLQQSTCSTQIPFPTGGSRGFVKATW